MADVVLTVLLVIGVLLVGGFVVAGLASPRLRRLLQRPAEDMLRRDHERWEDRGPDHRGEGGR
jgi:hypothetical protein